METSEMETSEVAQTPQSAQEMEDAFAQLITQIKEVRQQMQADDASIRQSNAEYAILRAEAQDLRKETEAILARAWSHL